MLESCPADKPNVETEWMLELLSVSIIESEDFHILERYVSGLVSFNELVVQGNR